MIRDLAADGVPVTVSCRVLDVARQPFYRWLHYPVSATEQRRNVLAAVIEEAHRDDPEFGYRFLADEVRAAGYQVCDRTVWRICSEKGWWSAFGKKRSKTSRPGTPAHDDLVRRDFTAAGPNQIWLSDITEHRTMKGKLYLCAIKDVWSNRIVGYSIDSRMKASLAVAAIDMAAARRGDVAGCIVHSDRGSQSGFNWSSQHLVLGGVHGSSSTSSRPGDSPEVAVAWSPEVPASCRGGVLGCDREGHAARRSVRGRG